MVRLPCFEMIQNRWDFLRSQIHIPERLKNRQQVIDNIQEKVLSILTSTTNSESIGTTACIYPRSWRTLFPETKYYTVRNTSMSPSFFGKKSLLIFSGSVRAKDKSNINFRILTSRAFRWTSQIFTPTNATADTRQNMILSHLFDW